MQKFQSKINSKLIHLIYRLDYIENRNTQQKNLEMGNMDSYRDWGHSKDYVRAMHMITNHEIPEDFVVSITITHSI
jgi:GDP-D-mannose dehydratase